MKNNAKKGDILAFSWSLLVDQFLAIIASFLLTNVIGYFLEGGMSVALSIISIIVSALIFYIDSWSKGDADYKSVSIGVIRKNSFKGLIAGFICSIPLFAVAALAFANEAFGFSSADIIGVDLFVMLNRFIELPLGYFFPLVNKFPLLNFALPLFVPLVSWIGYLLGINQVTLRQLFVYEK